MLIEIEKDEKKKLITFLLSELELNGSNEETELYTMFFNDLFTDQTKWDFYINENNELCLNIEKFEYSLYDLQVIDNEELKEYDQDSLVTFYSYNGYHLINNH
jgi:hypothetical protein